MNEFINKSIVTIRDEDENEICTCTVSHQSGDTEPFLVEIPDGWLSHDQAIAVYEAIGVALDKYKGGF